MSQYSFDEQTWRRSVESSERRRTLARERRKRQNRNSIIALAGLFALLVLVVVVLQGRRQVGNAPPLVVSWPQFQQPLNDVKDATNVAIRPGRPITISTTQSDKWNVAWSGEGVQTVAGNAKWDAVTDASVLMARCRPKVSGAARLTAWLRAPFVQKLQGYASKKRGDGLSALNAPSGSTSIVWLSPQVGASSKSAAWDERALPLLEAAATTHPLSQPSKAPRWKIVASFDGEKGVRAAKDNATYVSIDKVEALDARFPESFFKLAQNIGKAAPTASLKLIVKNDDTANAEGILRIAFDGSGARAGWKKSGEASGQPIVWWE